MKGFAKGIKHLNILKKEVTVYVQGVRLRLFIFRHLLESRIQIWYGWDHMGANICPIVILEYFFQKLFPKFKSFTSAKIYIFVHITGQQITFF